MVMVLVVLVVREMVPRMGRRSLSWDSRNWSLAAAFEEVQLTWAVFSPSGGLWERRVMERMSSLSVLTIPRKAGMTCSDASSSMEKVTVLPEGRG